MTLNTIIEIIVIIKKNNNVFMRMNRDHYRYKKMQLQETLLMNKRKN